jgi:hypothetical protein
MCFSEEQSYINTLLLTTTSIYVYPNYRLSAPLVFLALKDLIQGLSYRNIRKKKSTKFLTSLSWIHISFQPLFVNIFASHFDQDYEYWNLIFALCVMFGLYNITTLNEFDIQNDPDCIKQNKLDDSCSKNTESYIGKYHLGYKFSRDNYDSSVIYSFLMFIPALFTEARNFMIMWILFVMVVWNIFGEIGNGEKAAIWCFSSIVFAIPLALYANGTIS